MVRSFYVTLPSNGSMGVYPENTVTEFRNRLPRPLHLDGEWEVGLTNFSYPYTWYQICPETSGCVWRAADESSEFQELELLPLRTVTASSIGERRYLPENLVDLIRFGGVDHNGRLRMRAEDARHVKLTGKICQTFGCSDPYVFNQNWRYTERPWKAENIEHLFVYTDIIVPQSVGDRDVPLLHQFGVSTSNAHGQPVDVTPPIVAYHAINRNPIESIEIFIRDGTGQKVPFTSGRSIVTLHFRQRRSSLL